MGGGLEGIVLITAGVASFLVGLGVYSRNTRSITNLTFAILNLTLLGWSVANFFSLRSTVDDSSLVLVKIIFALVIMQNSLFLLFAKIFPKKYHKITRNEWLYVIYTFVVLGLLMTDYVIKDFSEDNLIPGPLIILFVVHAGISVILGFASLLHRVSSKDVHTKYLLISSLILWGVVPITNFVIPTIFDVTIFIRLSPLYVLLFNLLIAYAIIKHSLFDIRAIVARALAYIVSGLLLFSVYVFFASTILEVLITDPESSIGQFVYLVTAVLIVGSLNRLKAFLNSYTNQLFYRESYETQVKLDELSAVSVSEYAIDKLTSGFLDIIVGALKPSTSKIILLNSDGDFYSDYYHKKQVRVGSVQAISQLASMSEQIINVDAVEHDDRNLKHTQRENLIAYLRDNDIALVVRLSTKDEIVGYVLFGSKLSGNAYSSQDRAFMSTAANEMSVAIQNARRYDEIARFNETLRLEIDRATKQLRDSNEKLQALDQAKDEFISMASHQLRTPLTSVKGYLSMVLEGDVGKVDKKQRDMLAAAFTSSQRMVYLIADLLNVSRLQTGKFVIEPQVSDLPTVVESEIDQLKETARAKKLKVTFKKPKNFPEVYLDETKTRQVVMNFIDNAIYYTPNGGKIDIKLTADDKKIEYTVTDNGIGVPRHEQKNMFTKFYRASNAKKARPDGTGLGLFMAKKVVVDQGGALIFHSKEGEGSTFGFTFPLTRIRPPKSKQSKKKVTKKSNAKAKKSGRK